MNIKNNNPNLEYLYQIYGKTYDNIEENIKLSTFGDNSKVQLLDFFNNANTHNYKILIVLDDKLRTSPFYDIITKGKEFFIEEIVKRILTEPKLNQNVEKLIHSISSYKNRNTFLNFLLRFL